MKKKHFVIDLLLHRIRQLWNLDMEFHGTINDGQSIFSWNDRTNTNVFIKHNDLPNEQLHRQDNEYKMGYNELKKEPYVTTHGTLVGKLPEYKLNVIPSKKRHFPPEFVLKSGKKVKTKNDDESDKVKGKILDMRQNRKSTFLLMCIDGKVLVNENQLNSGLIKLVKECDKETNEVILKITTTQLKQLVNKMYKGMENIKELQDIMKTALYLQMNDQIDYI